MTILARTWRIKYSGKKIEQPALIGFWHGKMLPVWYYFRKVKPVAVISQSKDGSLLANLLNFWGFEVRRGSSSKGGKEVLKQITKDAKDNLVMLTPDGPRGPKYELKAGLIIASQRSSKPFYFINVVISNSKVFTKSWDHFSLPLPFSKVKLSVKGPYYIESDSCEEIDNLIINFNKEFKPN